MLSVLDIFFLLSGLGVNKSKTMLSSFGNSLDGSELAGSLGLKWCTKFKLIGKDFDQSLEEMDQSFLKPVERMQKVVKNWRFRYLTIFGKICVIKTLMLLKLSHIAAILPKISRKKI